MNAIIKNGWSIIIFLQSDFINSTMPKLTTSSQITVQPYYSEKQNQEHGDTRRIDKCEQKINQKLEQYQGIKHSIKSKNANYRKITQHNILLILTKIKL